MKTVSPREAFGLVIVGALAVIAWWNALRFDPYTMSFFTRQYIAPDPDMPRDLMIFGAVLAAIGGLVMLAGLKRIWRRQLTWYQAGVGMFGAFLVILFGAAFFVAADSAERHIEQEQARAIR